VRSIDRRKRNLIILCCCREVLAQEGIGHVVNCASECSNHFEGEIAYTRLALLDKPTQDLRPAFEVACKVITWCLRNNVNVLLHCTHGDSRAASMCVAFLMREKGATLLQAWKLVRRARETTRPNHGFFAQLVALELELYGDNTMVESDYAKATA
jgi:protein-tyrosine phosphatase